MSMPETDAASGDVSSKGSKARPAFTEESPLTAWARWGILTTIATNGKPVKKAVLDSRTCQYWTYLT